MADFIHGLSSETLFVLVGGGCIVLVTLFKVVGRTVTGVARERTRREIAAYIAEGSMTPEQGEKLMKAEQRERC